MVFDWFKKLKRDDNASSQKKFGTFLGVFVPNVTMMFGVILFMRLSIVVGYVGVAEYLAILAISLGVMAVTSLSIAMITTNMEIGVGGAYYLISRSLGVEFGGAIGIGLILSQIISLAVCTTGFAYTISFIYPDINPFLVEFATITILALISFVSANLALKAQFLIFCLLVVSIGSIFTSKLTLGLDSFGYTPYFPDLGFWSAFALMYPAMTGIEAGMALSGNLRNPSRSLWVGCLSSLLFVGIVYAVIGIFLYMLLPETILKSNPFTVIKVSQFPQIIYLGIWGATLSSALGNLLGCPRMIQSMAEDGIAPRLFQKTYGKYQEPRAALLLTYGIALVLIAMTTIDQILPIASMICLMTYGFLNLAAGVADWMHPPTWRPLVRIPWYLSLGAAGVCFILMFMISAPWAVIASFLMIGFYAVMRSLSLDAQFQDIRDSVVFFFSRFAVYYLARIKEHSHHWHPQILLFSKVPVNDLELLHLGSSIAERSGLLSVATIIPDVWEGEYQLSAKKVVFEEFLERNQIKGLVDVQAYSHYTEGVQNMIKSYGLGQLQPNTVMFRLTSDFEELPPLVDFIETAKTYAKNVLLFWNEGNPGNTVFIIPSKHKRIVVWWNPEDTTSFNLMLSYVHTLTSGPCWMSSQVELCAVVADEAQQKYIEDYLYDFVQKSRVQIRVHVFVEKDSTMQLRRYIREAEGADLIVSSLANYDGNGDFYLQYLKSFVSSLPKDKPILFVSAYDNVDHKEIFSA